MIETEDKLSEKWPWNGEFLRLFLLLPSIIGIILAIAYYPVAGVHSLWFLTAILVGALLYFIFGSVGQRVLRLKQDYKNDEGMVAEGLLLIGKIQSPGIVVLRKSELELIPIVGKNCLIPLSEIESIGEGRWLPGKFVWGKRVFTLNASILNPLAFAVPESIGAQWSPILNSN